jgi:UDP-4-amino-4-deoxy-L-arabinose-oxoglutarate aminotransferase
VPVRSAAVVEDDAAAAGPPWRRPASGTLRVSCPQLGDSELRYVEEVLRSGWWGYGPVCRHLEATVAGWCGPGRHALAVSSCTAALHLALVTAGVRPGDEVVVPAITYVATAATVLHAGAVPVFADVEPGTLTLSARSVEPLLGPRTRAVMPVHYAGIGTDFDAVRALVDGRGIAVVEDAAHALGARRPDGRPVGAAGAFVCFSFAPTKPLPSCAGGALVYGDLAVAAELTARSCLGLELDTFRRFSEARALLPQHVVREGWHYRLNDVAAAIAVAQLERLEATRLRRAALVAAYREGLAGLAEVELLAEPPGGLPSWYLMSIRVAATSRDRLRAFLAEHGVDSGVHYSSLRSQPLFRDCRGAVPVAEREAARIVTLPLHEGLGSDDVERVCGLIRRFLA